MGQVVKVTGVQGVGGEGRWGQVGEESRQTVQGREYGLEVGRLWGSTERAEGSGFSL